MTGAHMGAVAERGAPQETDCVKRGRDGLICTMQASCANITNRSLIGSSVRHPKLHKTYFYFFLINWAIGIRHILAVLMGRFSEGKVILTWKWKCPMA